LSSTAGESTHTGLTEDRGGPASVGPRVTALRATRPEESIARRTGRWVARVLLLLVLAMLGHLLVTSSGAQWGVVGKYLFTHAVLSGLWRTIYLTAVAMGAGIVIGTALALMRLSRSLTLSSVSYWYIWFFRGTPLLVQILFWYNIAAFVPRVSLGIPFGPSFISANVNQLISPLSAAFLALGLNEGAYMSEIIRAGIISIEKGQMEAALALGLTKGQAMRRVIIPQALRVIVPPTGNQTIGMLKGTSLVSVIALPELLYTVELIYSRNFETLPLLIVACIWYLVCTTVLSIGQFFLERYIGRGRDQRSGSRSGIISEFRARLAVLRASALEGRG